MPIYIWLLFRLGSQNSISTYFRWQLVLIPLIIEILFRTCRYRYWLPGWSTKLKQFFASNHSAFLKLITFKYNKPEDTIVERRQIYNIYICDIIWNIHTYIHIYFSTRAQTNDINITLSLLPPITTTVVSHGCKK